jgi:hypothetical protein
VLSAEIFNIRPEQRKATLVLIWHNLIARNIFIDLLGILANLVLQIGPAERKEKMLVSRTETSDRRAHRLAKCTYRSASTFSKAPSLRLTIFAVSEMRRGVVGEDVFGADGRLQVRNFFSPYR